MPRKTSKQLKKPKISVKQFIDKNTALFKKLWMLAYFLRRIYQDNCQRARASRAKNIKKNNRKRRHLQRKL